MYAIKLASLVGYRVVTTASPHNFELVKSLGASAVFDYKDPNVPTKIQEWIKDQNIGPLTKGLDTISESKDTTAANGEAIGSSIRLSLQAFGDTEGTLVTLCTLPFVSIGLVRLTGNTTVVPPAPEFKEGRKVRPNHILDYSELKFKNDDFGLIAEWNRLLPSWIEDGKLGPGVVLLNKQFRGLGQLDLALNFVRQGRVSGQKVVVDIDVETT
jgi:NADPH:quinone reductase-like Zn-dependent oxidoreductase